MHFALKCFTHQLSSSAAKKDSRVVREMPALSVAMNTSCMNNLYLCAPVVFGSCILLSLSMCICQFASALDVVFSFSYLFSFPFCSYKKFIFYFLENILSLYESFTIIFLNEVPVSWEELL